MDVGLWLRSLGLGQYEAAFRDNEIDGEVLPKLTAEDLKDLARRSRRPSQEDHVGDRGAERSVRRAGRSRESTLGAYPIPGGRPIPTPPSAAPSP